MIFLFLLQKETAQWILLGFNYHCKMYIYSVVFYYYNKEISDFMKKTIITVVGKDTVGIIAKVCTYLAENNINILDISQTIVQGYFNMMMIVDMNQISKKFGDCADELTTLCEEIGVIIKCQQEDIFNSMHRI